MEKPQKSWKEVIDKRRKDIFVGRSNFISEFVQNFRSEIPKYMLFFVSGEGGVGKSTLLEQFESRASESDINAAVVICDDIQLTPVLSMGFIAEQLLKFGFSNNKFDDQYKVYKNKKEEIESDPNAPRGALNLVVKGMTDFAIKSARRAPGVGVFAEYVDEKEAGEVLAIGVNYLINRFGNNNRDIELLRDPEKILTPLFIDLVNQFCATRNLIIMFDVFERTCQAVEPWLLELINFKYGEFLTNLTFVVSGRDPLDQHWTEIASSSCAIKLEPFLFEETKQYLILRGINDEQLIHQIHETTSGLPVLVELLAGTNPSPGSPLPDISKDAVNRFLQWIPEEEKRQLAIKASIPQNFNFKILQTIT